MKFGQKFIRPNKSSNRTTGCSLQNTGQCFDRSLALETDMEDKTMFYLDNPQRCHTKKEKELTSEHMLYVPKRLKSQFTFFALPCCSKPTAHVNSKWTEKNSRYFDGISTPKCALKSKCWRLGASYPKLMMLSRFRIF